MRHILLAIGISSRTALAVLPEDLVAGFGMLGNEFLLDFGDVAELGFELG